MLAEALEGGLVLLLLTGCIVELCNRILDLGSSYADVTNENWVERITNRDPMASEEGRRD
jgi:hypothetical protein